MTLDSLLSFYEAYEPIVCVRVRKAIIEKFSKDGKAPYLDSAGNPKEDEYLERLHLSASSITFKRRNGETWEVTFAQIEGAIAATLRSGKILGTEDYKNLDGKPNRVGTPLRLLISLFQETSYQQVSVVGKKGVTESWGEVPILDLSPKEKRVTLLVDGERKKVIAGYVTFDKEQMPQVPNA